MEDSKITIGFNLIDEFGNKYCAESKESPLLEENDLDFIGRQLNIFLSQCGYYRKRSYIFMESINEDEYEAIADFLENYRNGNKDDSEESDCCEDKTDEDNY